MKKSSTVITWWWWSDAVRRALDFAARIVLELTSVMNTGERVRLDEKWTREIGPASARLASG